MTTKKRAGAKVRAKPRRHPKFDSPEAERMVAETGRRVERAMGHRHLSQSQLGRQVDVHQTMISKITRGASDTSFSRMCRIARALQVPLDWLGDFEGAAAWDVAELDRLRDVLRMVRHLGLDDSWERLLAGGGAIASRHAPPNAITPPPALPLGPSGPTRERPQGPSGSNRPAGKRRSSGGR